MKAPNLTNSSFMQSFSESYLADLGRVVAAWSQVEHSFDLLFLSLVVMRGASTGSTKTPRAQMLMGTSFKGRIRMFRERLSEIEIPDSTFREANKVLDQLGNLRNERDQVAHASWQPQFEPGSGFNPDVAVSIYKSWKNLKDTEWKAVSREQLKETFEKIHALFWSLFNLALDPELRAQKPRQASP